MPETGRERQRQPRIKESVNVTLRLPADLVAAIDDLAEADNRSRNNMVVVLLRRALTEPDNR